MPDGGFAPWGRPGAGAPLTDDEGRAMAKVMGRCHSEQNEDTMAAIRGSREEKAREEEKTLKGEFSHTHTEARILFLHLSLCQALEYPWRPC